METFLEVPERALQSGLIPQDVTRQGTRSGRVVPVFAHPCMTINLSLTTGLVLVLCEIRLAFLPKRHGLCRAIRLLKHRIPLLSLVVALTQGLQAKTTTARGLVLFDHGKPLHLFLNLFSQIPLFFPQARGFLTHTGELILRFRIIFPCLCKLRSQFQLLLDIGNRLGRKRRILHVSQLFVKSNG